MIVIQVVGYRTTDIVISLWGGISMLNFLLRPGRVEIVITSWFEDNGMMPLPNQTTEIPFKKVSKAYFPNLQL